MYFVFLAGWYARNKRALFAKNAHYPIDILVTQYTYSSKKKNGFAAARG